MPLGYISPHMARTRPTADDFAKACEDYLRAVNGGLEGFDTDPGPAVALSTISRLVDAYRES